MLGVLKRESGDLKGALKAFNQHLILSPDPTSETSAIRTQTADLRVLLGTHLSIPPNQPLSCRVSHGIRNRPSQPV